MIESVILVSGKPGAGKSSCCARAVEQADLWAAERRVRHLSVGRHFRSIARGETPSRHATRVRSVASDVLRLALPAYDLVQDVVEEFIGDTATPGITLIDGYPREPELLPLLARAVAAARFTIDGCVLVSVSDEIAISRQVSRQDCGDDHPVCIPDAARRRVDVYNAQTAPFLGYVADTYGLLEVCGAQPPVALADEFIGALGKLAAVSSDG